MHPCWLAFYHWEYSQRLTKSLVLSKGKAAARLGQELSSSWYCSSLNFGLFKCFMKGHFPPSLFVAQKALSPAATPAQLERPFSPACEPVLNCSHRNCLQCFCRRWRQRGQIQGHRWRAKKWLPNTKKHLLTDPVLSMSSWKSSDCKWNHQARQRQKALCFFFFFISAL